MLRVRPTGGGAAIEAHPAFSAAALARAALDAVFPPACPACGAPPSPESPFCAACELDNRYLTGALCPTCGRPNQAPYGWQGPTCPGCAVAPPAFEAARSLAEHAGPLAEAVRDFKYMGLGRPGRWHLGPALGRLLARRAPEGWTAWADVVAPVPLHPLRLWKRGFNQALVLAKELAGAHGAPSLAPGLLARRRHTRPQVGLDRDLRRANVAGAFAVARPGAAAGKNVLLVDDVITTGATAHECAAALLADGARAVRVLTLVRAAGGGEPEQAGGG